MQVPQLSPYWKWDAVIPPTICDMIVAEFCSRNPKSGMLDGSTWDGRSDKSVRNSDIIELNSNHWLEGILFNHARWANLQAGWHFDINACEAVQVARYQKGGYYKWHTDDSPISRRFGHASRKLSAILMLSEPGVDYEGGGFLIEGFENDLLPKKGDLVVFPSFLSHTAVEVTAGERLTAVTWITGPVFK